MKMDLNCWERWGKIGSLMKPSHLPYNMSQCQINRGHPVSFLQVLPNDAEMAFEMIILAWTTTKVFFPFTFWNVFSISIEWPVLPVESPVVSEDTFIPKQGYCHHNYILYCIYSFSAGIYWFLIQDPLIWTQLFWSSKSCDCSDLFSHNLKICTNKIHKGPDLLYEPWTLVWLNCYNALICMNISPKSNNKKLWS